MPAENKIYTIPLRKEWLKVPRYKRAKKAGKAIKEFVARHMKIRDRDLSKIKMDSVLNEAIWTRGIKRPPHKITIKIRKEKSEKEGEEKFIVEFVSLPKKFKEEDKKFKKKQKKTEEIRKAKEEKKKEEEKKKKEEEEKKKEEAKTEEEKKEEKEKKEKDKLLKKIRPAEKAQKFIKPTTKPMEVGRAEFRKALEK